jgi:acetyl-CoA carboxylase biotin carboxyl carrier protein
MGRKKKVSSEPEPPKPFSVELIKKLAEVMNQQDLSELILETDIGRVRLRRGHHGHDAVSTHVPPPAHTPRHSAPAPAPAAAPTEAAKPARGLLEIKSEAIGTFYSRPNPESEPYVKVGARVTPTTVVGLIEAMKMFNEITAGVSGVIAEVVVENQQAVEYGTVLFRVEPS